VGNKINISQYDEEGRPVASTPLKKDSKIAFSPRESDLADTKKRKTHYVAKHQRAHPRQHAKTLKRSTVSKPKFNSTNQLILKSQGALYHDDVNSDSLIVKKDELDQQKLLHANQIARHKLVDRFKISAASDKQEAPKVEQIPVSEAPKTIDNIVASDNPFKKPENPFDTAVERADSHLQKPVNIYAKKRRKKHKSKAAYIVVLIAVIVGIYIFAPLINFEFVGFKAGFQAKLPGWVPPGYKLENYIVYSSQTVDLTYASYGNIFTLYEQHANVGAQALLMNYLNQDITGYQTVNASGNNVYIDSSGNATWVIGNIWFRFSNYSNLPKNQILNIASHL